MGGTRRGGRGYLFCTAGAFFSPPGRRRAPAPGASQCWRSFLRWRVPPFTFLERNGPHGPSKTLSRPSASPRAVTRRAVGLATIAYVAGLATHMTFSYYLAPLALRAIGVRDHDAWVFAGLAIAMMLTVLPAGRLADRIPRRHVLAAGLALQALVMVPLLLTPPTLAGILAGTLLTGVGLGLMVVSFNSYLADLLAARDVVPTFGLTAALSIVGSALGPLLAALVLRAAPPDALRFAAAPFVVFSIAGTVLALRSPTARGAHPETAPARPPERRPARRVVVPVMVLYVVLGAGYGMTAPYFTVYFLDTLHVAESAWGIALAVGTALSALGAYAFAKLAAQGAGAFVILGTQVVLALACTLFLFPLGALALAGAYLVRSAASNGIGPVMNARLAHAVDARSRAQAQALGSLAWNAGWAVGGAAGGTLLAALGGGAFAFGGALGLAGVAVGLRMLQEPRDDGT